MDQPTIEQIIRDIVREEVTAAFSNLTENIKIAATEGIDALDTPDKEPPKEEKPKAKRKRRTKAEIEAEKKAKEEAEAAAALEEDDSELEEQLDTEEQTFADAGELLAAVKQLCADSPLPKPQAIKMATETLEESFDIQKFGDVPDDMLSEVYAKMKVVLG